MSKKYKGTVLTKQNTKGKYAYFIESGICKIYKQVIKGKTNEDKEILTIPICTVSKGSIIGEECLFGDHKYQYKAVVESSENQILEFERTVGVRLFQQYFIVESLYEIFDEKDKRRMNFVNGIMKDLPDNILVGKLASKEARIRKMLKGYEGEKVDPLSKKNLDCKVLSS